MANLANRWAGRLFGTNTGNVFLDLAQDDKNLSGRLRIMDSIFGVSIYEYTGTFDEEIVLNCTPSQNVEGVELGDVSVKGRLTQKAIFVVSGSLQLVLPEPLIFILMI